MKLPAIKPLWSSFKKRLLWTGAALILILFIAQAALIDNKTFAILLAALGAGLATWLVAGAVLRGQSAEQSSQHNQLKDAQERLDSEVKQRTELALQVERLKSQALSLSQVQAVNQLTLLEVDVALTDFQNQDLGSDDSLIGSQTQYRYLGVLRKTAKVMLGIDLAKIRVQDAGDALVVSGVQAQFQGIKEQNDEWLLQQVQHIQSNRLMPNKTVVIEADPRAASSAKTQQSDLQTRLANGVEFKAYEAALERMGQEWVKLHLSAADKPIRFAALESEDGLSLPQYFGQTQEKLRVLQLELKAQSDQRENFK